MILSQQSVGLNHIALFLIFFPCSALLIRCIKPFMRLNHALNREKISKNMTDSLKSDGLPGKGIFRAYRENIMYLG